MLVHETHATGVVRAVELRRGHQVRASKFRPIAQCKKTFLVQTGRWQQAREEQTQPTPQSWPDKVHGRFVLINQVAEVGMHLGVVVMAAMGFKTQSAMLETMQEGTVTSSGTRYELKKAELTKPAGEALSDKKLDNARDALHDLAKKLREQGGQMDKAKENLAKLNRLCLFGCEEYNDLKEAIEHAPRKS